MFVYIYIYIYISLWRQPFGRVPPRASCTRCYNARAHSKCSHMQHSRTEEHAHMRARARPDSCLSNLCLLYIYIYICICICMCVCVYIYIYTYIDMYVYAHYAVRQLVYTACFLFFLGPTCAGRPEAAFAAASPGRGPRPI